MPKLPEIIKCTTVFVFLDSTFGLKVYECNKPRHRLGVRLQNGGIHKVKPDMIIGEFIIPCHTRDHGSASTMNVNGVTYHILMVRKCLFGTCILLQGNIKTSATKCVNTRFCVCIYLSCCSGKWIIDEATEYMRVVRMYSHTDIQGNETNIIKIKQICGQSCIIFIVKCLCMSVDAVMSVTKMKFWKLFLCFFFM